MVIKRENLMVFSSKIVLTGLAAVLIIVLVFFPSYSLTQAQTDTTFTPADKFSIPELNGSIRFSMNGSCSAATLENSTWIFNNLRVNNSQPLGTLKISAENSNVTVFSYRKSSLFGFGESIRYFADGQGKQTMNFGANSSQRTDPSEWMVITQDGIFVGEGSNWDLLADNTVVVNGLTGNVTVAHFYYNVPVDNGPSIILITAAVLAIVIAVAVVIRVKGRT